VITPFGAPPTNRARNAPRMHSRRYRLVVQGELSDRVEAAFEGMTLTRDQGNTRLEGSVRDQAELQALLRRVSDFGLTLLSANAIGEETGRRAQA
jgi:hypothetical protein